MSGDVPGLGLLPTRAANHLANGDTGHNVNTLVFGTALCVPSATATTSFMLGRQK